MHEPRPSLRTPTARLLAGLVVTLVVIGAYAAYTLRAVDRMRAMQTGIVERNRLAALQLLRLQNDLNALGLSLRDMLDGRDGYPLTAWRPALERMRGNLESALEQEARLSAGWRPREQTLYLRSAFADFWQTLDAAFARPDTLARSIRTALQPRQEALTALVARLLVENNARDSEASAGIQRSYVEIERNAWLLLGLSVAFIAVTGLGLIRSNRQTLARLETLAQERRELAQQLISTQESAFRGISRDLHDEFGQILTAVGALLRRASRHAPDAAFTGEVQEVAAIAQGTLDKLRSLSQSLQPVILEEQGLLAALQWRLREFERHTGITVRATLPEALPELPVEKGIHVYRIAQEALNNVARHAGVTEVQVRLAPAAGGYRLDIEDAGPGIPTGVRGSVGLPAMQERAALLGGWLRVGSGARAAGTLVTLWWPAPEKLAVEPAPREAVRG